MMIYINKSIFISLYNVVWIWWFDYFVWIGLNSSEDEENSEDEHLPWQNDWLVLSSDEDVKDE